MDEDLYHMAMELRSHADGNAQRTSGSARHGGDLQLPELANIYARLQRRVDAWGDSRSMSEYYFWCFLSEVLKEAASFADHLPDAPAEGGDCGGDE